MQVVLTLVVIFTIINTIWLFFLSRAVVNVVSAANHFMERPISDTELRSALKKRWGTRDFSELQPVENDGITFNPANRDVDPLSQWVMDEE